MSGAVKVWPHDFKVPRGQHLQHYVGPVHQGGLTVGLTFIT